MTAVVDAHLHIWDLERSDYAWLTPELGALYATFTAEQLGRARRIAGVCERHGVTLPEAALQFPLREPAVRSVVVGAATPEQARENAQRMEAEIPEALWNEL